MLKEANFESVYIACGYTDLRYGIDGLAATVKEKFELNPFSPHTIFLFCGRKRDRIKALVWEGDGFLLLYKRLEAGSFKWPRKESELKDLSYEQFSRLLQGFTIDPGIKTIRPPEHVL
ncbi:MAG: IS66 family insertion sequence element accessory protein TnpB [Lachnospiraceae bacterium]|nr:IS66 family insertion sequence element accessory protein TnpB [Lachnospiraceae bacterium]